jgi:hypothetical protein
MGAFQYARCGSRPKPRAVTDNCVTFICRKELKVASDDLFVAFHYPSR